MYINVYRTFIVKKLFCLQCVSNYGQIKYSEKPSSVPVCEAAMSVWMCFTSSKLV